jgi:ABC-type dipeptide/oligopeptide/nickel transport system ATPase component
MTVPLLLINNLSLRGGFKLILDAASLLVHENEIVALVGESGSGKSLLARSVMGLLPSKELSILAGEVLFKGVNLLSLPEQSLRNLRGRSIGYITQFPHNALNPIMTVGKQLTEAYFPKKDATMSARERALLLLKRVGFSNSELAMTSLPHQLSGGMRQRVLIAMALMNSPQLLIADEPTTALDVTLQAEILDLLQDLKEEYGLGILLITHDLGIVAKAANNVVILEQGRTIESGTAEDIFYRPQASYTQVLVDSLFAHPLYLKGGHHG